MTMIVSATTVTVVREVRVPRGAAARVVPKAANGGGLIVDAHRFGAIGSLQALAMAVVASAVVTGMLYLVL